MPDFFFLNLMNYDLIWFFKLKEKGLITFFLSIRFLFFVTVTLVFLLSWMVRTSTSLSYHHFSFSDFSFSLYLVNLYLSFLYFHFRWISLSAFFLLQFCLSFFYFPFKSLSGFFLCVHNSCLYFKCLFLFFFMFLSFFDFFLIQDSFFNSESMKEILRVGIHTKRSC